MLTTIRLISKRSYLNCFQSSLIFRSASTKKEKKSNDVVVQSGESQVEVSTFTEKAQQAAKDTGYSLIVLAGFATLGGLGYLVFRELFSRETPNGIYREASRLCLANTEVQDALGTPIVVHTTPQIGTRRIQNVPSKIYEERGRTTMILSFYLTGKTQSAHVSVKAHKDQSNKFVYEFIFVRLDRFWRGKNIIQVHENVAEIKSTEKPFNLEPIK